MRTHTTKIICIQQHQQLYPTTFRWEQLTPAARAEFNDNYDNLRPNRTAKQIVRAVRRDKKKSFDQREIRTPSVAQGKSIADRCLKGCEQQRWLPAGKQQSERILTPCSGSGSRCLLSLPRQEVDCRGMLSVLSLIKIVNVVV